jgi:hypothetical protein
MAKARSTRNASSSKKTARSVIDVILGEAVSGPPDERYEDMLAIASVIMNRAQRLGVTPTQVVSATGRTGEDKIVKEFDAYAKELPAGVETYRELAERALREVAIAGPVNDATFYATPTRVGSLPGGLRELTRTTGHRYFDDPQSRSIRTSLGFRYPNPARSAERVDFTPTYNAGPLTAPRYGARRLFDSPVLANPLMDRLQHLSSPARQSYLLDFLRTTDLEPGGTMLPETAPIPEARPRNSGLLDPDKFYPEPVRPARAAPRGGLLGPVMSPNQDRLGRPRDLPAGVMSRMSAAGSPAPVGGLMAGRFGDTEPSAAHNYGLSPSARMGFRPGMPTGFDQRYGLPDLGTAALQSNPNYRPGAAPAAPIGGSQRASLDARLAGVASAPDLRQAALLSNPTYQPAQRLPGGGTLGQIGPEGLPGEVGPSLAEINRAADAMGSPAAMAAYTQAQQQAANRERAFNAILGQPRSQPRNEMRFGAPPSRRSIEERAFLVNSTPNPGSTFGDMLAGMDRLAAPRFASNFPARPAEIAPNRFARQPQIAAPVAAPAATATPAETIAGQEQTIAAPTTYGRVRSAPRRQQRTVAPPGVFPPAPAQPTELDALRAQFPAALRNATIGALTGGVPGAAIGFVGSLLGPQFAGLGKGLPGPQPALSPYGVGSGLAGMSAAIGGRRGATAFSRSNPGMSYTSLGPNLGGLRRSDRFGWTEVVGPDGAVRGISYDNPKGGGLLGSLSRTVGGLLGGHFPSTGSGRDKGKKSDKGRYSGAGLY